MPDSNSATAANLSDFPLENRKMALAAAAASRTGEVKGQEAMTAYSVPEVIDENTPQPVKDFYNYYRNPERGYHKRSINSGIATDVAASTSYFHFSMFTYIDQIENPVLLVHGDQAYTYPEAKGLFDRMKGDNKKFYTVTGASHTDLYDQVDKIPFDEIEKFYREYFV